MPHSRSDKVGGLRDEPHHSYHFKAFMCFYATILTIILVFIAAIYTILTALWAPSPPATPDIPITSTPAATTAQPPPALRSICRAQHDLSTLNHAFNGIYPTLTNFLGIATHKPPFRESAETDPTHMWAEEQRQAILAGWVSIQERLASRSDNLGMSMPLVGADNPGGNGDDEEREVDEMTRLASSVATRIWVTLQDDGVRETYLLNILPQIERAGAEAAGKVLAEWKKKKKVPKKGTAAEKDMQDEMERGKRKAMAKWMEMIQITIVNNSETSVRRNMSPSPSPAAGTAVQGNFSGTRVVDAKESSVADLAEEHKRKVNEAVGNKTVDHAFRARQILRFLKDKHSGLKEHRQNAKNTLEGLDPGLERTKKLAESTDATAGEEKWMPGWESSPGALTGYIKRHVKKWIEKKTDEVDGPSTSEEQALAAGEEPEGPEAETEAESGGMPSEEGGNTTALDLGCTLGGASPVEDSLVADIGQALSKVRLRANVLLNNSSRLRENVLPSNNVQHHKDNNSEAVVEERRKRPIDMVARPAGNTLARHPVPAATAQLELNPRAFPDYVSFAFSRAMRNKDMDGATRALNSAPPAMGIDRDWYT
ncbi:hypothetical protein K4K50_011643, partial [Colletotrichum sp. SAR 10_71]